MTKKITLLMYDSLKKFKISDEMITVVLTKGKVEATGLWGGPSREGYFLLIKHGYFFFINSSLSLILFHLLCYMISDQKTESVKHQNRNPQDSYLTERL